MFGKTNSLEQSVLLCTIESGAVHASLCLMHPTSKPFIVHSATKTISFQETVDFERLASATLQALADACQEIATKGIPRVSSRRIRKGRIDAVYCTYGSPWFVSQTRHIHMERPEAFVVTRNLIRDMLAENSASKSLLSLADANDAPLVLEQNIIDIRLNGYSVQDPYEKKTNTISFSVVLGVISQSFSHYVEDVVSRFFAHERTYHHAGPAALFFGIRDTLASDSSFLSVDVSGELTDVSVVRDGVLTETVSFPVGVRTCMRSFSRKTKVLQNEIFGIMQGLKDKKIDVNQTREYESAATAVRAEWLSAFSSAILPLIPHLPLPKNVFMFGDSGEFLRVKDILVPTQLSHPQTGDALSVTLVVAENLTSFCVTREGVRLNHPLVPFSALHVHRLLTMKKENSL